MYPLTTSHPRGRGIAALTVALLATAGLAAAPAASAAPMRPVSATTQTGTADVVIEAGVYDFYFVGTAASVYGEITAADPSLGVPTGTVRVISNEPGNHTEEPLLLSAGVFYSDVYPTEIGTRTFTVEYSGDDTFAPASATFEYFVPAGPDTKTTLTADPAGPLTSGQTVTFTAHVTDSQGRPLGDNAPGQEITFYDNGVQLEGDVVRGQWEATLTTSSLSVGTHHITAESFAVFYESSTSNEIVIEVLPAERQGVSGSLSIWPSGIVARGTTVHATAEFHPRSGSGVVTGMVQFYDWTTPVGGRVALVDGTAHLSFTSLTRGPHVLTARYLGSDAYRPGITVPRFVYVKK